MTKFLGDWSVFGKLSLIQGPWTLFKIHQKFLAWVRLVFRQCKTHWSSHDDLSIMTNIGCSLFIDDNGMVSFQLSRVVVLGLVSNKKRPNIPLPRRLPAFFSATYLCRNCSLPGPRARPILRDIAHHCFIVALVNIKDMSG